MFDVLALFFTDSFQSEYDPIHLILGASIGVLLVVIVIKKITMRIKKKEQGESEN